jgi:hypothetical protein
LEVGSSFSFVASKVAEREEGKDMNGTGYEQFTEMLDDIEEALDAQELNQQLLQTQMVAEGAPRYGCSMNKERGA